MTSFSFTGRQECAERYRMLLPMCYVWSARKIWDPVQSLVCCRSPLKLLPAGGERFYVYWLHLEGNISLMKKLSPGNQGDSPKGTEMSVSLEAFLPRKIFPGRCGCRLRSLGGLNRKAQEGVLSRSRHKQYPKYATWHTCMGWMRAELGQVSRMVGSQSCRSSGLVNLGKKSI